VRSDLLLEKVLVLPFLQDFFRTRNRGKAGTFSDHTTELQAYNLTSFSDSHLPLCEQDMMCYSDFMDALKVSSGEISRKMVCGVVKACKEGGSEEIQVGRLRSVCEECGVPLGAISGILQMILPPDDSVGRLPWSHFVVALCAQVEGAEDVGVAGVVRLLLDPGMFGNDQGQISKADFIGLFDWWSSIDTSISAELKSALFSALDTRDDKVRDAACMHALARRVAEQ
jgi:hypothetical protein